MFKILFIIIFFLILFAIEIPKLIRKKEIKELLVFSFLGLIGFILSILMVIRSFI